MKRKNTHQDSGLLDLYLDDVLELPALPDDDQEAWSYLLIVFFMS